AHQSCACDLVGCRFGIDDAARIDYGDNPAYAEASNVGFPLYFGKLGAVGVKREAFRFWIFPRCERFAFRAQTVEASHLEDIGEMDSAGRRLILCMNDALRERDVFKGGIAVR